MGAAVAALIGAAVAHKDGREGALADLSNRALRVEVSAAAEAGAPRADGARRREVLILDWAPVALASGTGPYSLADRRVKCGTPCLISENRSRVREATALRMYMPEVKLEDLPAQQPGQTWIAMNDESPCGSETKMLNQMNSDSLVVTKK